MSDDPVDAVIAALNAFRPADDKYDDVENQARLYKILEGFRSLPGRERAMPAMFALLERFPDVDFGSPGPIVHELETIADRQGRPAHLPLLRESLARQPTRLTLWMVNRWLNTDPPADQRNLWLSELAAAYDHPRGSEETRRSVVRYLHAQAQR